MIRLILAVLLAVLYLILTIPILGIFWIIGKFNPKAADIAQLRMVQWIFKVIYTAGGTKVIKYGEENIPTDEPVLYIANHNSIFDVVIGYAQCPTLTGFIAKDSIKKVPLLRTWMRRLHCLFLNRSNPKEGLKVILAAIDQIKEGISIFVYPEGTRSKDGQLHEFKEGTFKIASKTGCKIIPVAMTGTADILEGNNWRLKKKTVIITYGEPIDINALEGEDKKKPGAYVNGIVAKMLEDNQKYL